MKSDEIWWNWCFHQISSGFIKSLFFWKKTIEVHLQLKFWLWSPYLFLIVVANPCQRDENTKTFTWPNLVSTGCTSEKNRVSCSQQVLVICSIDCSFQRWKIKPFLKGLPCNISCNKTWNTKQTYNRKKIKEKPLCNLNISYICIYMCTIYILNILKL
jgi:hypothetical protein